MAEPRDENQALEPSSEPRGGPRDREFHLRRVVKRFPRMISAEQAARLARMLDGGQ